ncbi:MAG: hypothetical protein ACE5Z5_06250 [Candidatus Bathyarchaeia archaeon]
MCVRSPTLLDNIRDGLPSRDKRLQEDRDEVFTETIKIKHFITERDKKSCSTLSRKHRGNHDV